MVTNAFIWKVCWLFTQTVRMHPLKEQTAFLEMDAFDSSALMTEMGAFLAAQMCGTGYADHNAKKPFYKSL